jgi:hypothetical protein
VQVKKTSEASFCKIETSFRNIHKVVDSYEDYQETTKQEALNEGFISAEKERLLRILLLN